MTTDKTAKYFIAVSLIGTGVFLLLPYAYVIVNSFIKTGSGSFAGLDNYGAVLGSEAFMTAMGNTALFMAVSVPVILALSLLISVYIYENPHLAGCLKTSFLIPMAIPVTSVVLMWRFLFDDNGIINGVLNACGMDTVNWMNTGAAMSGRIWGTT